MNPTIKKIITWLPNVIAAFIVLQTLPFKLGGAPESVALFNSISLFGFGGDPLRYFTAIAELIAGVLILIPKTQKIGAAGIIGLMAGALFFHITQLGFAGQNLMLAIMAVVAMVASLVVLFRGTKACASVKTCCGGACHTKVQEISAD